MNTRPFYFPTPEGTAGAHGEFDLQRALAIVQRRWLLIALLTLLGLAAGWLHYSMTPPLYQAQSVIQIERRSLASQLGSESEMWLENWWNTEFYPTQYQLLRSRGLAEDVVRNLQLIEGTRSRKQPQASPAEPDGDGVAEQTGVAEAALRLLGGLVIEPVQNTQLVEIRYRSPDPVQASRLANGFADTYIAWTVETRHIANSNAADFLASEIEGLKLVIQEKDRQIKEFSSTVNLLPLDGGTDAVKERLASLNQSLNEAVRKRIEKDARYRELLRSAPNTVAEVEASASIAEMRQEQARVEREYETKLQTFKPDWPEMVELRSIIDRGNQRIVMVLSQELERVQRRAYGDYQTALREEAELADEIAGARGTALASSSQAMELLTLQRELENRQDQLQGVLRRQSQTEVEARLQSSGHTTNVRVVDRALTPASPFRPILSRSLSLGAAGGVVLGVCLAFLLAFLDRTVKEPSEVEGIMNLPTLGVVPDLAAGAPSSRHGYGGSYGHGPRVKKNRRSGGGSRSPAGDEPVIELVPEKRPRMNASEAYRSIRAALLLSSAEELKTICVTSATTGDGKSATSANLAIVLAQLGRRVLLIDADLRKSRQHEIFGVTNRVGLVRWLTGPSASLDDMVSGTGVERLFVLPAGPAPPNPSELLASERMRQLLSRCRESFDFVILDTPPVLAVSDPIVVGTQCDGVVFCVEAAKSLREDLVASRERLVLAGVKMLGTVLNRFVPSRQSSYYSRKYDYYEPYAVADKADSAA